MTNNFDWLHLNFLEVKQPIGVFYVTSMKFQDVLDIAKSNVRKFRPDLDDYIGIQRQVSSTRKKEIATYVKTFDATFPTSITLAVNLFDEKGEKNIYVDTAENKLVIKKQYGVASIIDGQHRLEGLNLAQDENGELEFELNVTIFVNPDMETQAQLFSVINKSQTKVNKSLVYDLYEFATYRSPFRTAHNVVRVLNKNEKSPFYKKIKLLGTANNAETESITQATFAEEILSCISKTPIIDRDALARNKKLDNIDDKKLIFRKSFAKDKDNEITRVLYCYFDAIRNKWKNSWETVAKGNILNKSTGVVGLMKFLPDLCARAKDEEQLLTKEFYSNIIDEFNISDGSFTPEEYPFGGTGQDELHRVLNEELKLVCGEQKELTDRQFENAFTSAGGWFIVSQYRLISESTLDQQNLLNRLFAQKFDSDVRGTRTRLSAVKRIIRGGRVREAMEKIRDSEKINNEHPNAKEMAEEILRSL